MKLCNKLKLLREEKGLTQQQLSKKLGIGIQSVRNYESEEKNRIPNTVQLKLLKDFYNVTYEYLLDDNCENRTNESVDIGKKLKLSDEALQNIIDLQYIDSHINNNPHIADKYSPNTFNNWLEVADLSEFVVIIREYEILNNLLENLQYFSNFCKLNQYILDCIKNSQPLDSLLEILDKKSKEFKKLVSNSIYIPFQEHGMKDLKIEINRFKTFCDSVHDSSITIKDVENVTAFIEGIGQEYQELTKRTINYCLFEATEIIKKDLEDNFGKFNNLSLPA